MKQHQGVWFPDHEQHLLDWMTKNGEIVDGRGTYQIKKLRAAVAHCRSFRTAVDVGAHIGLWSMQLAKRFQWVAAFEPVAAHRECLYANIPGAEGDGNSNVSVYQCALGDHEGAVRIETLPTSSGDSRVALDASSGHVFTHRSDSAGVGLGDMPPGSAELPLCDLHTMDSFGLTNVDFIKLDCEGYELFALKGGAQTIARDLPVICVEQKPGRAQRFGLPELGAVEWLTHEYGYKCVEKMSGDYVMVPG